MKKLCDFFRVETRFDLNYDVDTRVIVFITLTHFTMCYIIFLSHFDEIWYTDVRQGHIAAMGDRIPFISQERGRSRWLLVSISKHKLA